MSDVSAPADLVHAVRRGWKWLLALGILFVVLGFVGLGYAVTVTIASVIFFGFLLIVGGAAQLVQSFTAEGWQARGLSLLLAVLYLVAGYWTVTHPAAASAALTLLLGWVLILIGAARVALAIAMRGREGWFWPLLSGLLSVILGGLVLAQWPVSGLFVIGLFIAIDLILNGWALVVIALGARRLSRAVAAVGEDLSGRIGERATWRTNAQVDTEAGDPRPPEAR